MVYLKKSKLILLFSILIILVSFIRIKLDKKIETVKKEGHKKELLSEKESLEKKIKDLTTGKESLEKKKKAIETAIKEI